MDNTFCRLSLILILTGFSLVSCFEDTTYRDAEYPDQLIYMPAAVSGNGQFVIDNLPTVRGELPFEGSPYRYVVDMDKREFRVPLSVYRSGIDNSGAFTVNINVNTDVISTINVGRADPYLLIPSDKYSLVNSVEMKNGDETALFELVVDLDLLRGNFPDKIFALGVEISSTQRERNENRCTTAVIIHTKMVKPTADFSYLDNTSQEHYIDFENSSLMSLDYQWNFGDGTAVSGEKSPSHKYSSSGTYTVTLTAIGITGEEDKSVKTIDITVP